MIFGKVDEDRLGKQGIRCIVLKHLGLLVILAAITQGASLGGTSGKGPTCQCRRQKRCGFNPWVRESPWRWAWQSTPVFLPGESHGQRDLVGYSPWARPELDMTERLTHTQHGSLQQCMSTLFVIPSFILGIILKYFLWLDIWKIICCCFKFALCWEMYSAYSTG